ncbi:MAG: flippase [Bacilli bacterium]|nr:flippase [Bacilli bacterium]
MQINEKKKVNNKSIGKNYILNVIYQVFLLIVPLITTPYLSRVLGVEGIGQYSFSSSIANYFALMAALGFGYYAQREIAKHQGDKESQSIIFWEILIVRFFSTLLSTLLCCSLEWAGIYKTYSLLMWWWVLYIVGTEFDVTFFFQGNEDFGKIVGRNLIAKILSIILIFCLVKNSNQVWVYLVCNIGGTIAGNLSLWFYLPKCLQKIDPSKLRPWRHFAPTLRLFLPTIATSVYTMLDKTLLGLLIQETYVVQESQLINGVETIVNVTKRYSDLENGYYEQSEKVVKMAMTIITALGIVMIPRNSTEFAKGNIENVKRNIYYATNFVWALGIPLMLGIAAIAPNLVPWFLGNGFKKCILLMQLFTPLILIIGFSNVFGLQYLVPTQRDGKFTIGIISGAITNLILDVILIHFYWSIGAVIATLVAETVVTSVMMIMIHKEISFKRILFQSWKYLIAGGAMFACVYVTQHYLAPTILNTFLLILEGIVVYALLVLLMRDRFSLDLIHRGILKIKQIREKMRRHGKAEAAETSDASTSTNTESSQDEKKGTPRS